MDYARVARGLRATVAIGGMRLTNESRDTIGGLKKRPKRRIRKRYCSSRCVANLIAIGYVLVHRGPSSIPEESRRGMFRRVAAWAQKLGRDEPQTQSRLARRRRMRGWE